MENVENLILEHLRSIRADIAGMRDDIREIKQRLSNVESGIGSLKRDTAYCTPRMRRSTCVTTAWQTESRKSKNAWNSQIDKGK